MAASRRTSASSVRPTIEQIIWAFLDFATAIVAGLLALRIRGRHVPVPRGEYLLRLTHSAPLVSLSYLTLFGLFVVVFARTYGLYRPPQNRSGLHEQRMTIQTVFISTLLLCGTLYVMRGFGVSRIAVGLTALITLIMLMLRRALWRRVMAHRYLEGLEARNVLIVGTGRVAHALRNHLESLRHMGFRFKGFVAMTASEQQAGNADIVGSVMECVDVARALFVDEIFFSTPADKRLVIDIVEKSRELGINVRVVPDLYDGLAWNAPIEFIGQFPTIPLHRRDFPRSAYLAKRVLDVTVASVGLLLLSPALLVMAIAVRYGSVGPVFYRAKRIGRKGRAFNCYKFRTMVADADRLREDLLGRNERDGVLFKISNDPRVTRVGAVLRKYSLDELPQLWNVLLGEMSLVGPRPPMASEVEKYDISHLKRLDVLPGMTGLWQVEARQDPSFDSYISLDTAYVDNWNLMLDLRILARTISVVFSGTGS
jgi:exopolysaccharide biosynthesis polyprenyl glycosylphosphotransferase